MKSDSAFINSTQCDHFVRAVLRDDVFSGRKMALCVLVCGAFYGAMMGTFGGFGGRWSGAQMLFSAIKVPGLLLITFALCLPGFFVLNALSGLAEDFPQARRALLRAQAAVALILATLSPFTLLFYASSAHYQAAILFNALIFAIAAFTAQRLLNRVYAPLFEKNPRHVGLLRLWLALYGFTGVQLAYVLRPFIGDPNQPIAFFRSGAWDNAYVVLWKMLGQVLGT